MFDDTISLIKPLDVEVMEKCQLRLDNLTKPLGSLHSFEHIAKQMAGITGNPRPGFLQKSIIIMAGDHGVITEGENLSQKTLTAKMVVNVCRGVAGVNVFAQHVSANLVVVDVGVATPLPTLPQLYNEKVGYGTKNIALEAAMTRDEAIAAIQVGIKIAQREIEKGACVCCERPCGNRKDNPGSDAHGGIRLRCREHILHHT